MNGEAPPYDSQELLAVAAYITWLSKGQPMGESPVWRGQNVIAQENLVPIERLDPVRGRESYGQYCTTCHGADGQGVDLQTVRPGPLWGPRSWNDGAGAARVYTLAGYIRYAMPLNQPGVLSDEEAQHIAAYINAQERPAYAGKAQDFPAGAPVDADYYPRYPVNPLRAKLKAASTTAAR
jgi:thiosulfate dehydrogenase